MKIHKTELVLPGSAGTDIHDVTGDLQKLTAASAISQGLATVHTPGSTAAVTTIEYESGVLEDLTRVLDDLAPATGHYAHNARWGDGNGYSHVRAALLGPSLTVPVADGQLRLGKWQQVVVMDFDNRPRSRKVLLQVMGE